MESSGTGSLRTLSERMMIGYERRVEASPRGSDSTRSSRSQRSRFLARAGEAQDVKETPKEFTVECGSESREYTSRQGQNSQMQGSERPISRFLNTEIYIVPEVPHVVLDDRDGQVATMNLRFGAYHPDSSISELFFESGPPLD
jgi:hypothetical protein